MSNNTTWNRYEVFQYANIVKKFRGQYVLILNFFGGEKFNYSAMRQN